jgi:DNA polymerase-4
MMEKVLGKNGIDVWKKANGVDSAPVKPYNEQKSISTERTFQKDTIDIIYLRELLVTMVEKLAYELRHKEKLTSCVTVKIRYSNFDTHTLQKHIPYTSFDHILIETAKDLFSRLYKRRMLIRLIGVRFSHLVSGVQQLNMFEDTPEMVRLYLTLDSLRNRFGRTSVRRAVGLDRNNGDIDGEFIQPAYNVLHDPKQSGQTVGHSTSTEKRLWKISRPDYLTGMNQR